MTKETTIKESVESKSVNLRNYLKTNSHPLLCLGPMSKNSTDAIIRYSNQIRQPIPIICSRRQIECEDFGGGYVNGWSTESFSKYVNERSRGYAPLCRDHGGPWQGAGEINLPQAEAMERAKKSFLQDIAAGFDVLHLDPFNERLRVCLILIHSQCFLSYMDLYVKQQEA